jgi:hypothetical protein
MYEGDVSHALAIVMAMMEDTSEPFVLSAWLEVRKTRDRAWPLVVHLHGELSGQTTPPVAGELFEQTARIVTAKLIDTLRWLPSLPSCHKNHLILRIVFPDRTVIFNSKLEG